VWPFGWMEKFSTVRKCIVLKHLEFDTGKECVLVRLSPPVIGQDYGLGTDIEDFVLTNRHGGEGLSPIREYPCFVFIARPLVDDIGQRDEISKNDLEIIAWGELYRTESDAEKHVFD
jgi:hypothetical protein